MLSELILKAKSEIAKYRYQYEKTGSLGDRRKLIFWSKELERLSAEKKLSSMNRPNNS
jgi:hypothetical protein